MIERREGLYNRIADAFDPKSQMNREKRMDLLLSALYELNEATKKESNETYQKELSTAIQSEVDKAVITATADAIARKQASGDTSELTEEEKASIESKERTKIIRNKEKQIAENLMSMIKSTANSENEDIQAARGVLTAVMREPEAYGLSSKMRPLLAKLYGTDTVSIIPKHNPTAVETESAHWYAGKYIEKKFAQTPENLLSAEFTYLVMSRIRNIYKKFKEEVEQRVLTRLSKDPEVTQDDIPLDIIDKTVKKDLNEYLRCSEDLLEKNPGISEKYKKYKLEESQNQASIALGEIKSLIETVPWELGIWGSKAKIKVDGVDKQIPSHMKQIYDKVVYAENDPEAALRMLDEIHTISQEALQDKPKLFSSFRERYQSTTKAYEEIEKQSDFKLH